MTAEQESISRRLEWEARYLSGPTPWDTGITPPEVRDFWRSGLLPTQGIALDLGCGTGTNSMYLASLGLQVFGLELSRRALTRALDRLANSPQSSSGSVFFLQCDVSRPPIRDLLASYVLDIGCLHGVPRTHRSNYASAVVDNLLPGGYYHLYAHDAPPHAAHEENTVRGLDENEVERLFSPHLALLTVVRSQYEPRPSRWYLLRKTSE